MTTKKLIADILLFISTILILISYWFIVDLLFKAIPIYKYIVLDYISIGFLCFWCFAQMDKLRKNIKNYLKCWSK